MDKIQLYFKSATLRRRKRKPKSQRGLRTAFNFPMTRPKCLSDPPLTMGPPLHVLLFGIKDHSIRCKAEISKIKEYCKEQELKPEDIIKRKVVCGFIQTVLRKLYANCSVDIFGSVNCGLATQDSDLNLCVTLHDYYFSKDNIINEIALLFLRRSEFHPVSAITCTRFPIVKLKYDEFDVNLTIDNELGLMNTELLKAYTSNSDYLNILAISLKKIFKEASIPKAANKGLSSYAIYVLAIHYLQQCDPPILPVLETECETERKTDFRNMIQLQRMTAKPCCLHLYQKMDVSKSQNMEVLSKNIEQSDFKNSEDLCKLLLGFFKYYAKFQFWNYVVTINQRDLLLKHCLRWNNPISIQDPIDPRNNLGFSLSKKNAKRLKFVFSTISTKPCSIFEDFTRQNWFSSIS